MKMLFEKEHSWSLLDPRPVCFYDQKTASDLCVWNGIYLGRNQALIIASARFMNLYATPGMKDKAYLEFRRAYYAGAFGHNNWDSYFERCNGGQHHLNTIGKMLDRHIKEMPKYTGQEVWDWFKLTKDYTNADS
jgi:hypothetical protein